jgi:hypothetical protein
MQNSCNTVYPTNMVSFRYIIENTLHKGDNNDTNNNCPFRHYSIPHVPEIKGIEEFKGLVQHSKVYRSAEAYRNLRVVVLGAASSGVDIGVEVSAEANEVRYSYGCISVFLFTVLQLLCKLYILYRLVCHTEGAT